MPPCVLSPRLRRTTAKRIALSLSRVLSTFILIGELQLELIIRRPAGVLLSTHAQQLCVHVPTSALLSTVQLWFPTLLLPRLLPGPPSGILGLVDQDVLRMPGPYNHGNRTKLFANSLALVLTRQCAPPTSLRLLGLQLTPF